MIMKNLLIITCAILLTCFTAKAADNYKVGDTLYVWAPSGLNVRTGPSTFYNKMGKLEIGDYVVVKRITSGKYITNGLSAYHDPYGEPDGMNHPYQLGGKWIEVENDKFYGYAVDIYLLKIPYQKTMEQCFAYGDLENMKTDTLHGDFDVNYSFPNQFAINVYTGEGGGGETLILPGFTIEEGYVLANAFYVLEPLVFSQEPNWFVGGTYTDKLYLADEDEFCSISFELKNGYLSVDFGCHC